MLNLLEELMCVPTVNSFFKVLNSWGWGAYIYIYIYIYIYATYIYIYCNPHADCFIVSQHFPVTLNNLQVLICRKTQRPNQSSCLTKAQEPWLLFYLPIFSKSYSSKKSITFFSRLTFISRIIYPKSVSGTMRILWIDKSNWHCVRHTELVPVNK